MFKNNNFSLILFNFTLKRLIFNNQICSFLNPKNTGRYIDALKHVLNNAPLGSPNQQIKVSNLKANWNYKYC